IIYDTGTNPAAAEQSLKTEDILWAVYLAGVVISLFIFAWKLYLIKKAIQKPAEKQAFSFFKTIVIDPSFSKKGTIELHEQVHAEKWHSADILFFELLAALN